MRRPKLNPFILFYVCSNAANNCWIFLLQRRFNAVLFSGWKLKNYDFESEAKVSPRHQTYRCYFYFDRSHEKLWDFFQIRLNLFQKKRRQSERQKQKKERKTNFIYEYPFSVEIATFLSNCVNELTQRRQNEWTRS